MKNFEMYKDKILEASKSDTNIDCRLNKIRKGRCKCYNNCQKCRIESYEWLYEDVEIKLYQWEYDLIETNDQNHKYPFNSFKTYKYMKERGYFKGVYDDNMSLEDILKSSKIVESYEDTSYEKEE